jgi:predicted ATP-dependent serine protease
MNAQKTISLQEIIRQRQQDVFVGRQEHTAVFRQNLLLPLDDELRRFVFSVSGQGGVGKSEILKRFRQLAEDIGAITVLTDESVGSVHATMSLIAQ